jgi:two-component system, chemotaxis family, chemotaxis protein CheY
MSNDPALPKSILVVEDDEPTRTLVMASLKLAGYNVTSASGRAEVLGLLRQVPFDLVLTDVIMPDFDGTEVVRAVRQYQPSTPVLAMSGGGSFMTSEFSLRLARSVGAGILLLKPFQLEELLRAVENAITGEVPPVG